MQVRNEKADEFLALLKGWHSLCDEYVKKDIDFSSAGASENEEDDDEPLEKDEFVVEKLAGICYGGSGREDGLYFKVPLSNHLHIIYGFLQYSVSVAST